MKKYLAFFAVLIIASFYISCGKAPQIEPIELTKQYNGQYFSIFYPESFEILTSKGDLSLSGNSINLVVKKEFSQGVEKGNLKSLNSLKYELERKAKEENSNLLVNETIIGTESAMAFEYENNTKYGLLYAIPQKDNIILVGSENPQDLGEGEAGANRVEQIKAILASFRITRPEFFEPIATYPVNENNNDQIVTNFKVFENEFFKLSIPENWNVTGQDMITIQPSDQLSISEGQEISITNISNAGKPYQNYALELGKTFKGQSLEDSFFGQNAFKSYMFMLDGQERIHLFTGKLMQVIMINASSHGGKLSNIHEEILKSLVIK